MIQEDIHLLWPWLTFFFPWLWSKPGESSLGSDFAGSLQGKDECRWNVCVRAQWDYKPLLHEASAYRIYSSPDVWQSLLSILVWHLLLTILFLWIVLIFSFYLLSTVKKISFFLVSYCSAWHIVGALLLHMGCVLKLLMHSGWTGDPGLVLSWICLRRSSSGLTCWSRENEFWLVLGPRSLL